MAAPSVVVDDLYVVRVVVAPEETDTVLVVDANAVLPFAVPLQRLKPVSRWNLQVIQSKGRVENCQLLPGGKAYGCADAPALACFPKQLGVCIAEADDHP